MGPSDFCAAYQASLGVTAPEWYPIDSMFSIQSDAELIMNNETPALTCSATQRLSTPAKNQHQAPRMKGVRSLGRHQTRDSSSRGHKAS